MVVAFRLGGASLPLPLALPLPLPQPLPLPSGLAVHPSTLRVMVPRGSNNLRVGVSARAREREGVRVRATLL